MKKIRFFVLMGFCLIGCVQPLNALPTELKLLFEFGESGAEPGNLDIVTGIAVNEHDEIIVVDAFAQQVAVFDRCGNFLFNFGGSAQFDQPQGVAVTEDNNIVIVDILRSNFQVFDRCGNFIFESEGGINFKNPSKVATNRWGEMAVDDSNNNVQVFDRCGNFLFCLEDNPPLSPSALAYDDNGNLYVGNRSAEDNIKVYDRCGRFLFQFGSLGTEPGQFTKLAGIAISESGEIITVENLEEGRIQVFDRCGDFLFEFEGGLFFPLDVAVNSDGDIYIVTEGDKHVSVFRGQTLTHDDRILG